MSNIQITVEKPVLQCIYRWIMYRLCNLGGWSRDRREEDGGRGLDYQVCLRRPSPISLTITPSVTPMEALNNTTFYGICSAVSRREGMGYLIIWAFSVIMAWNGGRWPTMPCGDRMINVSTVTHPVDGGGGLVIYMYGAYTKQKEYISWHR